MGDWGSRSKTRSIDITKLLESFKKIEIFKLFSMGNTLKALLVTCKDVFGTEISFTFNDIPKFDDKKIEDYCWIDGSYTTLPSSHSSLSPYVGVTSSTKTDDGSKFYHPYYQWVYFAILIQAIMFFSLKWVWDRLLDQRVIALVGKLKSDKKIFTNTKELIK